MTRYIELAPREDFADILDSIERFIILKAGKTDRNTFGKTRTELRWFFHADLIRSLHSVKSFNINLTQMRVYI